MYSAGGGLGQGTSASPSATPPAHLYMQATDVIECMSTVAANHFHIAPFNGVKSEDSVRTDWLTVERRIIPDSSRWGVAGYETLCLRKATR